MAHFKKKTNELWAVVAQSLLPTADVRGSIPVIGTNFIQH